MTLDERKRQILRAIVTDYINTAEPVGSRTLARKYLLGISPATIRNEMADLEEIGYLQQPHTSAGRIPSDKGYRFYVDVLMDHPLLPEETATSIRETIQTRQREIEEAIHHASYILSYLTNYTAVVLGPMPHERICEHVKLVGLDPNNVLVVLMTLPGFIENRLVEVTQPLAPEELERASLLLTERLRGTTWGVISAGLIREVREIVRNQQLAEELLHMLGVSSREERVDNLYLEGTTKILDQPEFKDLEKVRTVLGIFEGKQMLLEFLAEAAKESGVVVSIGQENRHDEFRDFSFVTASYESSGRAVGTLGVIGPTRMDYARAISAVGCVAGALSELLSESGKRRR
ncbi:MAG: heat-inducible transcriptional repressor HrcA [Syntrophothermus sp.]